MKAAKQISAAERLRQHKAQNQHKREVVDVLAPSGFTYKFEKPSKFKTLFGLGVLPQIAASAAAEKWTEDGLIEPSDSQGGNSLKLIETGFKLRDRVLELSVEPKWVIGVPQNDNEVSTDEIPDEDLEFFLKWVGSGGELSAKLSTFPDGREPDSLASAHRPKQRNEGEQVSGD